MAYYECKISKSENLSNVRFTLYVSGFVDPSHNPSASTSIPLYDLGYRKIKLLSINGNCIVNVTIDGVERGMNANNTFNLSKGNTGINVSIPTGTQIHFTSATAYFEVTK